MESFDLKQLANATGHPVRLLRYVVDHEILPHGSDHSKGHRVTRRLLTAEAFATALGASMLASGLRRELTAAVIAALCVMPQNKRINDILLYRALHSNGAASVEIVDGRRLRLHVGGTYRPIESGWIELTPPQSASTVMKIQVTTTLHLEALRDAIRK